MLADTNSHSRDSRIDLEPTHHRYYVDGQAGYLSVTAWNKRHFAPFDATTIIARMRAGKNWAESEYFGLSDLEIKKLWKDRGRVASEKGTELHDQIECYFNGQEAVPPPRSKEYGYFPGLLGGSERKNLIPYRTEWVVFDESIQVAGAIDMIFQDKAGAFHMYDWKRTKPIVRAASWGFAKTSLPAAYSGHQFLALCFTAKRLQSHSGKELWHFH